MRQAGETGWTREAGGNFGSRAWFGFAVCALAMVAAGQVPAPAAPAASAAAATLRQGRTLLQGKDFPAAKRLFASFLRSHPKDVQAELGIGDAELGLHEYEAAEASYRAVVAQQPELWQAHKNLVVVEAALRRWEDFDGERTVLRLARQRGAPGISPRESDVIDSFEVDGQRWVVRSYFEPLGRSQALYNFERFSPTGRVEAYISLEDADAAQAALTPRDERIGAPAAARPTPASRHEPLALNWYTGRSHGTILRYTAGEPTYERLRTEVIRWLRTHPAALAQPAPR